MYKNNKLSSKYKKILIKFSRFSLPTWTDSIGLRVGLLVLFFGLFGCYFYQVGSMSKVGYEMRDLENKIAELEIENQKLEVEIASWSSLGSIESRLVDSDMVAISNIKYIDGTVSAFAKR